MQRGECPAYGEPRPNSTTTVLSFDQEDSPMPSMTATSDIVRSNQSNSPDDGDMVDYQNLTGSNLDNEDGIGDYSMASSRAHSKSGSESKKKFYCTYCKKCFNLLNILKVHVRIHTGEKPYVCTICQKRFNQSGSLNRHIQTHSRRANANSNYPCRYCNLVFIHSSQLQEHESSRHFKENPQNSAGSPAYSRSLEGAIGKEEETNISSRGHSIRRPPTPNSQFQESRANMPSINPFNLPPCPFPDIPMPPSRQLMDNISNHPSNLDFSGPLPIPPHFPPFIPPPFWNGLRPLNDPPSQGLSGFSAENLIDDNKSCQPPLCPETFKHLLASITNGKGSAGLPIPPPNPAMLLDPSFLSSIMRINDVKDQRALNSTQLANSNAGPQLTSPSGNTSNNSGCTSPNSEPSSTSNQQVATPCGSQQSGETVISRDGRHCSVCDKPFNCRSALKIHFRKHTGEKPYICVCCKKSFSQNGTLKRHYATCKVAKSLAHNEESLNSVHPLNLGNLMAMSSLSHTPRNPPTGNRKSSHLRPPPPPPVPGPILPPNLFENFFPNLPGHSPPMNIPPQIEKAFKFIFESYLAQKTANTEKPSEMEFEDQKELVGYSDEPEDLSSKRMDNKKKTINNHEKRYSFGFESGIPSAPNFK